MPTFDEIFEVEQWVETSVSFALKDIAFYDPDSSKMVAVATYLSRGITQAESPRLEIKAMLGAETGHSVSQIRGVVLHKGIKDQWHCVVDVSVFTNRQDDSDALKGLHAKLLGMIRRRMQLYFLLHAWQSSQSVISLGGSQDKGTVDSFIDESDLDVSRMQWLLSVGVNANAWPSIQ